MNEPPEKLPQSQRATVRAARTALDLVGSRPLGLWLTVGAVTGIFLALVGALDSYSYSLWFRLGFWMVLCLTGAGLAAAIESLLDKVAWRPERGYLKWLALILCFAGVMTPIVYLANSTGGLRPWRDLLMFFQNSLVISSVFIILRLLVGEIYRSRSMVAKDRTARSEYSAFVQRLPPKLRGGELRALCAEGHYIRAWTDVGSDLVLFRLKDAISELRSLEGMQVHRSWWVARAAIRGSQRKDGRLWLVLDDDIRVPVSRPNVKKLKAAGWL